MGFLKKNKNIILYSKIKFIKNLLKDNINAVVNIGTN
jgi:hypothetical protein